MQDIQIATGFKPGMLHVVEIRFNDDNMRELLAKIRRWCAHTEAQPTTFRYCLSEPDSLLRVNFERKEQADAFAQAFDDLVLVRHPPPIGLYD